MPFGRSWVSILILLAQTFFQIVAQENAHGRGEGATKKRLVMTATEAQIEKMRLSPLEKECSPQIILENIGDIVDSIVTIGNCLGIFKRG